MAAVVVATQASSAELQPEVCESDRLTLPGTGVRRQLRQYQVPTGQVSTDTVHVLEAAEVAVLRCRLCVVHITGPCSVIILID